MTPSDPTQIFELYRGSYATELLVAAVKHFNLIAHLAGGPLGFDELRQRTDLAERPLNVLLTAIRAMGLITTTPDGRFDLPAQATCHLLGEAAAPPNRGHAVRGRGNDLCPRNALIASVIRRKRASSLHCSSVSGNLRRQLGC